MNNPSLREEPRSERAAVIPLKQEPSILDWLEQTGRLLPREPHDEQIFDDGEEDISDLMGADDGGYDDLDDDDEVLDLEE